MVLVVPGTYGGLPELESKLTHDRLTTLINNFDRSGDDEVQLTMPKFTMEVGIDLKDVLENMGVKRIFDSAVNPLSELSHIGLHIGAAVHKGK